MLDSHSGKWLTFEEALGNEMGHRSSRGTRQACFRPSCLSVQWVEEQVEWPKWLKIVFLSPCLFFFSNFFRQIPWCLPKVKCVYNAKSLYPPHQPSIPIHWIVILCFYFVFLLHCKLCESRDLVWLIHRGFPSPSMMPGTRQVVHWCVMNV